MATVTSENIGLLNEKIIVTVTKEDYYPEFEKGLKEYSKKANIPGFRKGMVPAGVLKKMYGNSLFVDQVVKAAEKQLVSYIENQSFKILGQPIPFEGAELQNINYNNIVDYIFNFEIGLEPEINTDLSNANLIRYKIAVTDKFIDDDLEGLRKRYGKYSEPETVNSIENYLALGLEASDVDGNILNEADIAKPVNVLVKYFNEPFQSALLGKAANDTFVFKFSDAFTAAEEANVLKELEVERDAIAESYFKATITRIGMQESAELNEELYKKAFPNADIKSEEELKAALKEEIANNFYDQSKYQIQDQIYHHFLDHSNIELPLEFLRRWLKLNLSDKNLSEEELERNVQSYSKSILWTLIMDKYVSEFGINIDKDDFVAHAKEKLLSYMQGYSLGDSPNHDWINSYAEGMLKDKKFMEESYYEIRAKKVFDELDKKIPTTEKDIELEAFREMLHHHHH